jgi:hypothetical protein
VICILSGSADNPHEKRPAPYGAGLFILAENNDALPPQGLAIPCAPSWYNDALRTIAAQFGIGKQRFVPLLIDRCYRNEEAVAGT